jgi:hypothetical protein
MDKQELGKEIHIGFVIGFIYNQVIIISINT